MQGYTLAYTERDDLSLPRGRHVMELDGGLTYPQMIAAARLNARMTGEPTTIIDDEGEETLTLWP